MLNNTINTLKHFDTLIMHSICEDIEKRRIPRNFKDEENKDGDHPKLWKNFAKALERKRNEK